MNFKEMVMKTETQAEKTIYCLKLEEMVMKTGTKAEKTICCLKLKGKMDASTFPNIKKKINALIEEGHIFLILDLNEVYFIDSSGLGCLVACLRKITEKGGDIKLCGIQDPVRLVIELTQLHKFFDIFDDVPSAKTSFLMGI